MATVHSLNIGIKANAQPAIAALGSLKLAIGGVISALAVRQVSHTFLDTAKNIDRMSEASRVLGVNLQDALSIDFASQLAGLDFETLFKATNRMRRNIVDAAKEGKPLAGVFDANALKGMKWSDQMATIADRLRTMTNVTERTAVTMKIFGKEAGANMFTFLENGGQGIRRLDKLFGFLAGTVSNEMGGSVERMNDSLDELGAAWTSIKNAIVIAFAPGVTGLVENVVVLIKTLGDQLRGMDFGDFGSQIDAVAQSIADMANQADEFMAVLVRLKTVMRTQLVGASEGFFKFRNEDLAELAKIEKRIADRRVNGSTFGQRFRENLDTYRGLTDSGSAGSSPSRASLMGGAGGIAEELAKGPPLKVHLTDESAKALVAGTVEAADEVNRLQREALLAPERARIAAEQQAAKQELAEAKKANSLLGKISDNTKNAVVLAPAGL